MGKEMHKRIEVVNRRPVLPALHGTRNSHTGTDVRMADDFMQTRLLMKLFNTGSVMSALPCLILGLRLV